MRPRTYVQAEDGLCTQAHESRSTAIGACLLQTVARRASDPRKANVADLKTANHARKDHDGESQSGSAGQAARDQPEDEGIKMTRDEAHKILNRVREGFEYPAYQINKALKATGDIGNRFRRMAAGVRSQGMAGQVDNPSAGKRIEPGEQLVGRHDPENRTQPRTWCSAYLAARHEQGPK